MTAAIRDGNPIVFIGHQNLYRNINCDTKSAVPEEPYKVEIGKANIVKEGKDVTLISYSWMLYPTLKAAEMLENEGYKPEVIDLRSLSPLDMETIGNSVIKTGKVVIAHQAIEFLGMGAEIAAQLSDKYFSYLDAPIKRVCALFCVPPCAATLEKSYGKPDNRKRGFIPGDYEIYKAAKEILTK